jgi:hypothetical protein
LSHLFVLFLASTVLIPIALIYIAQWSPLATWTRTLAVSPATVSAVFLVFGLNLAFVSNEVWGTYDKARTAVASEGDTLRNLARMAQSIKAPIGRDMLLTLQKYEAYTVQQAWDLLAVGSWETTEAGSLGQLAVMVSSDEMSAATKPTVQSQLMTSVTTLRSLRNQRFALASSGLNPMKWSFTCFLDIVAIFAIALANMEKRNQHIMASLLFFTASTPTIALLVIEANPFAGIIPVSAQPIAIALDHVTAVLAQTQ